MTDTHCFDYKSGLVPFVVQKLTRSIHYISADFPDYVHNMLDDLGIEEDLEQVKSVGYVRASRMLEVAGELFEAIKYHQYLAVALDADYLSALFNIGSNDYILRGTYFHQNDYWQLETISLDTRLIEPVYALYVNDPPYQAVDTAPDKVDWLSFRALVEPDYFPYLYIMALHQISTPMPHARIEQAKSYLSRIPAIKHALKIPA